MDIEMTVDPELYSIMVLVFCGTTLDSRRFKAAACQHSGVSLNNIFSFCSVTLRTWHGFDVIRRMHGHHLGVDSDSIVIIWIKVLREFNQG